MMVRPMKAAWLLLLGLLGLYGGTASASGVSVLCHDDIKGESTFKGASGCIDVLAWSWGLAAPTPDPGSPGGGAGGVAAIQGFTVTKYVDSSSDNLFSFVTRQMPLNGIVEFRDYHFCVAGCGSSAPYLTIHMRNTLVSSQSVGGSAGDDRHTENVTFTFGEVSYCYRAVNQDGSLGDAQCFAWSAISNTEIDPF